nr:hypothetical protein [Natrialba taiwanensis]
MTHLDLEARRLEFSGSVLDRLEVRGVGLVVVGPEDVRDEYPHAILLKRQARN